MAGMTNCNYSSSDSSSPSPECRQKLQFSPSISVTFSNSVTKNGDALVYTVDIFQDGAKLITLNREYGDFEYLEHCITTSHPCHGMIFPPLPVEPFADARGAELKSKKQMGKSSKILLADDFSKDCRDLQRYIELLLSHPIIGQNEKLVLFLTQKEPPPRVKVKKNIMSRLTGYLDHYKSSCLDCEEFFQKERTWLSKYLPAVSNFCELFDNTIFLQTRFFHQLDELTTSLKLNFCHNGCPYSKQMNGIAKVLMENFNIVKVLTKDKTLWENSEVSSCFILWKRYIQSEENMLIDRVVLMLEYQACNRALEKVKPNRKEVAEKAKQEAEATFEECSDLARQEIKRFHRQRAAEMEATITKYIQFQFHCAKKCMVVLQQGLVQAKAL